MSYRFKRGIPAVFVEIYLPKKSAFQGELYKALTEGNDPKKLKEHLLLHAEPIKKMLQSDWPVAAAQFTREFVDELASQIGTIYRGYSLYEVDGVFFSPGSPSPAEERSQVIRIFFEYQIDSAYEDGLVNDIKRFLWSPSSRLCHFEPTKEEYHPELAKVETWVGQIGVFLIGFLMHRIVLAVEANPYLKQEEIWMTSFWDGVINKFVPIS